MRADGPGQPAQLLLDVVDLLTAAGVPHALVGAFAVSFHGMPRSTNDGHAIVWLAKTELHEEDLLRRLEERGFRAEWKRGDSDDPLVGVIVVADVHENRVDLLLGVRGMAPEAADRIVSTPFLDSTVRILGGEDLIAMKVFAGGHQDLEDARGILQVSRERLDLELLKRLTRRYGNAEARTLEQLLSASE